MAEAAKTPPKTALIAGAVLIAAPLTASFEGLRTHLNRDPVGLEENCYGDRFAEHREYTAQECMTLLVQRETRDYAPGVLKCVPGLAQRQNVFAASIDAAYNGGVAAFCKSPMAADFNRGDWADGCARFSFWRVTAKGKALPGLQRRRNDERALCLRGLA